MDIPATELFIEILVSGILLLCGFAPLLVWLWHDRGWGAEFRSLLHGEQNQGTAPERGRRRDASALPPHTATSTPEPSSEKTTWPYWIVVIALVYTLGVAGNRVIEETESSWCRHFCSETGQQEHTSRDEVEATIRRNGSDLAGAWLERQKSYRKILRTAYVSAWILVASLIAVRLFAKNPLRKPSLPVAALLAIFLSFASHIEEQHFTDDIAKYLRASHAEKSP
jgi:hypothetical protein